MAGDAYRRWQTGERRNAIPAALMNEAIQVLRGQNEQTSAGDGEALFRQAGIVKVRNDSGADREQFEILGLGPPIITPTDNLAEFKRQVTFQGMLPAANTHKSKIAILLEPIRKDRIGRAVVSGVIPVKLTGATANYAEIIDGDAGKLRCGGAGSVRVLWAEDGAGERWALVRLGDQVPSGAKVSVASGVWGGTAGLIPDAGPFQSYHELRWSVEEYDTDNYVYVDPAQPPSFHYENGRFVVPNAGYYRVTAEVAFVLNGAGARWLSIFDGYGKPVRYAHQSSPGMSTGPTFIHSQQFLNCSYEGYLDPNAHVDPKWVAIGVAQSSGGPLQLAGGLCWASISRLC